MSWEFVCTVTDSAFVSIPPPCNEVEIGITSLSEKEVLYNGEVAFSTPPTKVRNENFTIELSPAQDYFPDFSTVLSKLQTAINGHYNLELTTHTTDVYTGYLLNLKKKMRFSGSTQDYILSFEFVQDS